MFYVQFPNFFFKVLHEWIAEVNSIICFIIIIFILIAKPQIEIILSRCYYTYCR